VVLDAAPLALVQSVTVRAAPAGSPAQTLTADVDYRIVDAARAVLRVEVGWDGSPVPPYDVVTDRPVYDCGDPSRVAVVYTQPAAVAPPADVGLASTQSVAAWFAPLLPADQAAGSTTAALAAGIKRYSLGQEESAEYFGPQDASSGSSAGTGGLPAPIPAAAAALLAPYGYPRGRGLVFA
jgi:hypothetical protein